MTSKEIFDSSKESEVFDFTMRTTSNDLKRVNTYGDASYISTDQELPYDNEKDELSSIEIFVAGIMESMILTIIREAKIARAELDEIEGRASNFRFADNCKNHRFHNSSNKNFNA